jgi:hypothetical protein
MHGPHGAKPAIRDAVKYLTIKRKEIMGYHGTKNTHNGLDRGQTKTKHWCDRPQGSRERMCDLLPVVCNTNCRVFWIYTVF